MKILFLTMNNNTQPLIDWLSKREDVIKYSERLTLDYIKKINPNLIVSYGYRYIIKDDIIDFMPKERIINLHISMLPWNKCACPNFWSWVQNTPKGVTIHCIDKGIDTGNILLQKEVIMDENKETLRSSYDRLQKEIQQLFMDNWDNIKNNKIKSYPKKGKGSYHSQKDFDKVRYLLEPEGYDIIVEELIWRYNEYLKCDEMINVI